MSEIHVRVLRELDEGLEVGSQPCACGGCRPTATIFRDDLTYARHDPALAQGPCCCGRFFVVGPESETRSQAMAIERGGAEAYRFERSRLELPWGGTFPVVIADLRQ